MSLFYPSREVLSTVFKLKTLKCHIFVTNNTKTAGGETPAAEIIEK